MRREAHGGFGERSGETDPEQSEQRAPDRLNSNINSNRTISRTRSPISCTRYRVNIRSRRISGGGTNDGANSPCSNNCAIHSASRTSLLRPGTAFMWAAFNNHTDITSSRQ